MQKQKRPPQNWGESYRETRRMAEEVRGNERVAPKAGPSAPPQKSVPRGQMSPSSQRTQDAADRALAARRREMARGARPEEAGPKGGGSEPTPVRKAIPTKRPPKMSNNY